MHLPLPLLPRPWTMVSQTLCAPCLRSTLVKTQRTKVALLQQMTRHTFFNALLKTDPHCYQGWQPHNSALCISLLPCSFLPPLTSPPLPSPLASPLPSPSLLLSPFPLLPSLLSPLPSPSLLPLSPFPAEFKGIDMWMLKRAIAVLQAKGKAELIRGVEPDDSDAGVKFFS